MYDDRYFRGPLDFDSRPIDLVRLLLEQAVDRRPEPTRLEDAIRRELDRREAAESMENSDEFILEIFRQLRK
jgi:hypothetical protein